MSDQPLSGIERLLARLQSARPRGRGQWMAICPAHDDRNPSLSIRETADGRVLIHCFAGCSPCEILQAIDLSAVDLVRHNQERHWWPSVLGYPKRNLKDLIPCVALEARIVLLAGEALADGEVLTEKDLDRLRRAVLLIEAALVEVRR